MALPSSGQITLDQIREELEVQDSPFTLGKASTGDYATINTNSSSKPDGNTPHSMSEWHGYDHSASASWSLSNSLSHDGVNDWSRFTGTSYANICTVFNGGGTIALAFRCTGTTSNTNQAIWQGGWGGGNNWLLQSRDYSSSRFQLRFRHDFSGNNYISEPATSTGQRYFSTNLWYFLCLTYNNGSTSNNATWYYGDYSGTSLTTVSSPVEISSPSGTKSTASQQYPALSGYKGNVTRPFKGNITMVGMWNDILTSSEVSTLFNSGSPYQMSNHSDNLRFFHDMASVSGTTVTPETGGSGYSIALNNGASQSTTIPS